jgi:hypothetical protein
MCTHRTRCPATQSYKPARLPPSTLSAVHALYEPGGLAEQPSASEAWFELVSNRSGIAYLAGTPDLRYEMAPTVDNVAACLGILLGEPSVTSLQDLEALWRRVEPTRGLRLYSNDERDRLYVAEDAKALPCVAETPESLSPGVAEQETTLIVEFVLSTALNHAFAIHKWTAPSWHTGVADIVRRKWRPEWWRTRPQLVRSTDDVMAHGISEDPSLPRAALLPALLHPLNSISSQWSRTGENPPWSRTSQFK